MSEKDELYKSLFNQLSNQLGSNQLFSELCNVYSSSYSLDGDYSPDSDLTNTRTGSCLSSSSISTATPITTTDHTQMINNQIINNGYTAAATASSWSTVSPEAEQAFQINALQIEIANMKQAQAKLEETVEDLKSILKITLVQLKNIGA